MNIVIYHDHCTDGFGAAYAAWLKLGDAAQFKPMSYGAVNSPQARLTVDEVLQIRNSRLSGKILSQIYGVSPGHISNIRNGNSWKNE